MFTEWVWCLTRGNLVSWSLRMRIFPIRMERQHSRSPFSMASPGGRNLLIYTLSISHLYIPLRRILTAQFHFSNHSPSYSSPVGVKGWVMYSGAHSNDRLTSWCNNRSFVRRKAVQSFLYHHSYLWDVKREAKTAHAPLTLRFTHQSIGVEDEIAP